MPGGEASYYGFEYQIYASVLLMLIEHQRSNFVGFRIETDFGNDAEAIVEQLETLKSLDILFTNNRTKLIIVIGIIKSTNILELIFVTPKIIGSIKAA